MDGACEHSLNRGQSRLDLPAVVGSAVVGENDLPVGHKDSVDGSMTRRTEERDDLTSLCWASVSLLSGLVNSNLKVCGRL